MKRRLLSAFLAVMMVLTMAPVAFAADTANTEDVSWSGEGTEVNPYQIKNVADLQALSDAVAAAKTQSGKHFKLEEDIDMSSVSNWTPIGNLVSYPGTTFSGTFDGNGKTISNLTVSDTTSNYATAGLFGSTNGTIKNLTLKNVNVTSTHYAGGIVAYSSDQNNHTIIDNCHVDGGTITSTSEVVSNAYDNGDKVGGIVGYCVTGDTIANCSVKNVTITAYRDLGGIVGCASGTVSNCTVGENVKLIVDAEHNYKNYTTLGQHNVNSIIGRNVEGATVSNCTGTVTIGYKDAAAKIDVVEYLTLAAAIENADNNVTITLLRDVTEDVVIPAGKTVTLDLNGKKLTNVQSDTITVTKGAKLTIEGAGTVDNVTHARAAVFNNGEVVLNGGTFVRSKENGINAENSGGNSWYTLLNHGTMTINDGTTVLQNGHFSSMVETGYARVSASNDQRRGYVVGTNAEHPSMTINGGMFTGGLNTVKNDDNGIIEIKGGTFTNYTQAAFQNHHIATITGGTFDGVNVYAILNCGTTCDRDTVNDKHQLTITGGNFNGKIYKGGDSEDGTTHYNFGSIAIKGGYFTVDPTTYCAEGKTGVASGDKKYPFTVGDIVNNVKVVPSGSTVSTGDMDGKSDVVKNAMETARDAIGTRNTTIEGLAAVGSIEATEIDSAEVEYETEQLKKQGVSVEGKTVTFYIRPYMGITVMDATVENNVITSVTYNIVPQIQKIVSTATSVQDIRFNGDNKNAIRMNCQVPEVTTPITLSLPLPTGFATENLKVKHEKNGKLVGYHDTTYNTADNTITFTNDKGFSTFTVLSDARSTTIQFTDKDNHNIGSAKSYGPSNVNDALPTTAAESGYVFNGWKFEGIDGVYTTLTDELLTKLAAKSGTVSATPDFSKRSSGSSGGSSSGKTTYKVTTSAVNNGGVNASPSNAEKGASITITLSPDKGYKLDKLTVTDGSGKTVSTVKKSDTVYTFTMPASAVKVGVSYVKATETPSKTKFNDVSANDWFASAVDYVTGKGMMNGTADNTFSPKANTTRGMVVTVLYRLENQPSTSAASFTDVASGAYYANAVAWANANGIVSGYGSGKFGPNDKVTREQLAAILYRYAQYKKYDVSGAKSLDGYTDAQSVSSYAVPALQWANAAGVVTGKSGSKLDPKGNATRAEVAAMLMRFCENVK